MDETVEIFAREPSDHTMPVPEDIATLKVLGAQPTGVDYLRAHVETTGGEHRPQQEKMVATIEDCLKSGTPALIQAGTGTGKSLGYLFPVAAHGKRTVVATATNQLSEQLIGKDLPQVAETLRNAGDAKFTYALLKGRANYVCLARMDELTNLERAAEAVGATQPTYVSDALFDVPAAPTKTRTKSSLKPNQPDPSELGLLFEWAKKTKTGDRTEAPAVQESVWAQISVNSADCPGAGVCPFSAACYTERARARAREATVVVTSHALLAQDLKATLNTEDSQPATNSILGQRDAYVIDEAHDFPGSLTSAFSEEVDPRTITTFANKAARHIPSDSASKEAAVITDLKEAVAALEDEFTNLPTGPLATVDQGTKARLEAVTRALLAVMKDLAKTADSGATPEQQKKAAAASALFTQAENLAHATNSARHPSEGTVRWVDLDRKDQTPVLRIAPIEVGFAVQALTSEHTLVATSATLSLGGDFTPIARTLGLDLTEATAVDVGSPFDYPRQGMLYIPTHPFPEPVGKDRVEHTRAVLEEIEHLVRASGGRALCLFTTTTAAKNAAETLRSIFPGLNVFSQGDAPASVLVRQFSDDETSVLCATMGMWQGLSVPGPSCSLVTIDKIAFAPPDDVLTAARRAHADAQGRDGFTEVIVAAAAISAAQGAGRLIRTQSDKGVVAILDTRLHTKGYRTKILRSLPDFRIYTDREQVGAALRRLTGGLEGNSAASGPRFTPKPKPAPAAGKVTRGVPRRAGAAAAQATKNLKPRPVR